MNFKRMSLIIGLTMVLVLVVAGMAMAAPFTMKTVPQTMGFPDKVYTDYTVDECRNCHGSTANINKSTADLHHNTATAVAGLCTNCHKSDPVTGVLQTGTAFDRNCFNCHDYSWHHKKSPLAAAGNCSFCHDGSDSSGNPANNIMPVIANLGAGLVAPEAKTTEPTNITPRPISCANCHNEFNPAWDPTTQSSTDPLAPDDPNMTSHHLANFQECGFCHDGRVDGQPSVLLADIRKCESCHTITTLHNIPGHVDGTNKCQGCHADYVDQLPPMYELPPAITVADKTVAKKGEYITLEGANFGFSDTTGNVKFTNALGTFQAPTAVWTDNVIQVLVPATLPGPDNYDIVVTTPVGQAMQAVTIIEDPKITNLKNSAGTVVTSGKAGDSIEIFGSGFLTGTTPATVKFGNVVATATVKSGIQVSATVPALAPGKYVVTVTTDNGVSNPVYFTVGTPAKISSLSPSSGKVGYTIIVYGSNLNLGTKTPTVKFGSVAATSVSYVTATKLYVKVPAGVSGTVSVTLDNGFGPSNALNFKVLP